MMEVWFRVMARKLLGSRRLRRKRCTARLQPVAVRVEGLERRDLPATTLLAPIVPVAPANPPVAVLPEAPARDIADVASSTMSGSTVVAGLALERLLADVQQSGTPLLDSVSNGAGPAPPLELRFRAALAATGDTLTASQPNSTFAADLGLTSTNVADTSREVALTAGTNPVQVSPSLGASTSGEAELESGLLGGATAVSISVGETPKTELPHGAAPGGAAADNAAPGGTAVVQSAVPLSAFGSTAPPTWLAFASTAAPSSVATTLSRDATAFALPDAAPADRTPDKSPPPEDGAANLDGASVFSPPLDTTALSVPTVADPGTLTTAAAGLATLPDSPPGQRMTATEPTTTLLVRDDAVAPANRIDDDLCVPAVGATIDEWPAPVSDGSLLQRFVNERDQVAFTELVARHERMVFSVCQRVLRDAHLAEDAFQATFVVLARKAAMLDWQRPLASWLFTVAYHIALRLQAVASRRRRTEATAAGQRSAAAHLDEPQLEHQEVLQVLREEVHRLPEKYRLPLTLHYFDGCTHDEVARTIGMPRGSLAKRIGEGLQFLRERLSDRGISL